VVQDRRFLGDTKRVCQRHDLHAGPDLDPLGASRDRGTKDQRAGGQGALWGEMQFRQPHHVETGFLGGVDDVEPGGEALGLAAAGQHRKLVINTQFHRTGPSPHANPFRHLTKLPAISAPGLLSWAI
jgi:hypothetical protein